MPTARRTSGPCLEPAGRASFRRTNPVAPDDAPPNASLFRQQALAHAASRPHGEIVLALPVSHRWLTGFFVLIALGLLAFLACASVTHKVRASGVLLPSHGWLRVLAPQGGVISEQRIAEGQAVQAGEVLFVLSSERASASEGEATRKISSLLRARRDSLQRDAAQAQLQASQTLAATQQRIDQLQAEARRIDEQIALQHSRVALAEATRRRYAELQAAQFVSPAQLQDKQAELLAQQQARLELERHRAAREREAKAAQAELQGLRVQAERDQQALQRQLDELGQDLAENEARREVQIRAPQAGTVSALGAQLGQAVTAAQPLATVMPADATLQAELYLPSRAIGFVQIGMPVLLRHEAYAYQKFGMSRGRVREIGRSAIRAEELAQQGVVAPASLSAEPLYRVRVALEQQSLTAYGEQRPLKAGTAVDASIQLERRRLYEWVLAPLYGLRGRL